MATDSKTPSSELLALVATDRGDLAARLFVAAYLPKLGAAYLAATAIELSTILAGVGAVTLPKYMWNCERQPEAGLIRLVLECVLRWESAGLAARLSREHTEVVVLGPGESVLHAVDPEAAVQAVLGAKGTAD